MFELAARRKGVGAYRHGLRRAIWVFFGFGAVALTQAQVWDKFLAPGLTYRMEVDLATPRIVHAFRFSPQSRAVSARTEVATRKVFTEDLAKSRRTVSAIAREGGAMAAINGDFFPWTGDPIGLMVRDGELVSGPWPNRAVFGWGRTGSGAGIGTLSLGARNGSLGTFPLDGLNEECGVGKIVLNTPTAGWARTKGPGVHVVLKGSGNWGPKAQWEGVVDQVVQAERYPVPEGGAVISAGGASSRLMSLKSGDPIRIEWETSGLDWSRFDQAIGGGPFLIKNGQIAIDWDFQGFRPGFANDRHPRTAVGRTKSGEIWFVAIDGRQALSAGATLDETARIMKRYGCIEAVNLDGGGSTTLHLLGLTLNRPSGGVEREVANAVLFFGEPTRHHGGAIKIQTPEKLFVGQGETLKVVNSAGVRMASRDVVWQALGSGWIDQGGLLRPTGIGVVKVSAWSEGQTATAEITVVEKPKPPPVKKKPVKKKRRPLRRSG